MGKLISVVIPVYNEELCLEAFNYRIQACLIKLTTFNFELIYVNDGSQDSSLELLRSLMVNSHIPIKTINLSRNFGHQAAIECGMRAAAGEAVVTIDADLQDPPEVIPELIEKFSKGFDVVLAKRLTRRGETKFKKITAYVWYRFLDNISELKLPRDVADFRLLSRKALDELLKINEADPYLRGLVSWIGFKQTIIEYSRDARFAGKTNYTFSKMIKLATSGITNFSVKPLKLPFYGSLIVFPFALIGTILTLVEKFTKSSHIVQGYSSLFLLILWSFSIQMFALGVIGEYLAKNFSQSKSRPRYVIDTIEKNK